MLVVGKAFNTNHFLFFQNMYLLGNALNLNPRPKLLCLSSWHTNIERFLLFCIFIRATCRRIAFLGLFKKSYAYIRLRKSYCKFGSCQLTFACWEYPLTFYRTLVSRPCQDKSISAQSNSKRGFAVLALKNVFEYFSWWVLYTNWFRIVSKADFSSMVIHFIDLYTVRKCVETTRILRWLSKILLTVLRC